MNMERGPRKPREEDEEVMSRRDFLRGGAKLAAGAAVLAAGLGGSEEAEAFGSLSVEEFEEYADKLVVPEKFGDINEVKQSIKDRYSRSSMGQKMLFSTLIVCNGGGTPTLVEYDSDTGSLNIKCL